MTFRPIGRNVLVMFPQGEWEREVSDGFMTQTGFAGMPFRMDGLVVSVGDRVDGVGPGDTVYGDPRRGKVLVIDDTMYHIMKQDDLEMKAVMKKEN